MEEIEKGGLDMDINLECIYCTIKKADSLFSNYETLFGCGKNIYYIFLCKCDLFTKRFNLEKFKGVFVNERNVKDIIE